jgi:hypothetical protein
MATDDQSLRPAPSQASDAATLPGASVRGILCAKCEHLNPAGRHHCEYCKASLLIACKFCGQRNSRVDVRCAKCGHRLHRSPWRKWQRWLVAGHSRITWHQVVLLVVAVYVGYRVIVKIAEYNALPPM